MIQVNQTNCPRCGGKLKRYDKVKRVLRTKDRDTSYIEIRRFRCTKCGSIHREMPESVIPYKQYEADVIFGVREKLITPDTLGFENYPCEMTMNRWTRAKNISSYGKTS